MEEKPIGTDALNLAFEALSLLEDLRHEGKELKILDFWVHNRKHFHITG